jgi:sugar lactone lactonase YvrE
MGTPGSSPYTTANEPDQVTGHVDFGGRSVQATIDGDIMPGSTIALIEVDTGNTVSTARSDEHGKFVLKYSNGFKPVPGKLYYFEALKGLPDVTGKPNAVGSDLVRVRTIASYRQGGWLSLTSSRLGFYMPITPMTTALSILVSLRSTTDKAIDASTLFGSIWLGQTSGAYPDTLVLPDPILVPPTAVRKTYDLVIDAFLKNRDPMRWVTFTDANFESVMLPDVPFTISRYAPTEQVAMANLDIVGTNFSPRLEDHEVVFQAVNNTTATAKLVSISPDLSHLTVEVPAEAVSGPIILSIGTGADRKTLVGPTFRLASRDGHSVIDLSGNIYVVNPALNMVAKVGPLPTGGRGVRAVIKGLSSPGALTFAPGDTEYRYLYVAQGGGTRKVYRYDLNAADPSTTGMEYGTGLGAANPSGMAFQVETGALYVTDAVANKLYVIPKDPNDKGAVEEVALNVTLSAPRGICFGPDRRLYLANSAAGSVLAITMNSVTSGSASPTPYLSGLSTPWGVAFDNLHAFYVSNNKGNSVYKKPVTSLPGVTPRVYGPLTSFASIPTPGGIDADASGYLFVADNGSNGIYQVNPSAEARQIGFGISNPIATWADTEGIFALTNEGRILKIDNQEQLIVYAEGLNGTAGLVRDKHGNFYTVNTVMNALVIVRPDGSSYPVTTPGSLTPYYPELSINKTRDRLYFRKGSSDLEGFGQVDAFDLNLDPGAPYLPHLTGALAMEYRGAMRRIIAIAADRTALASSGTHYVLQGNENGEQAILRATVASGYGTTYDVAFLVQGGKLKNPVDIAVASDGRIWVADLQGEDTNGGLLIYEPDGTFVREIKEVVNPVRLAYDPVTKYVAVSCQSQGEVRFYGANSLTSAKTLTNLGQPVGIAFGDTAPHVGALFVNNHADAYTYRLTSYNTRSGNVSGALESFYNTGNNNDIEVIGDELIYTSGAAVGGIKPDKVTVKANWQNHYSSYLRLNRDQNEKLISVTAYSWAHLGPNGSHSAAFSGLRGYSSSGTGGHAILSNTMVAYSHSGYSDYCLIVGTDFDRKSQTSYVPNWNMGAATSDGQDTAFFAKKTAGGIIKWTVDPLTKKGRPTTLVGSGHGGLGTFDTTLGLAYHDGFLYQPIRERHLIRKVDVTKTNTVQNLNVGLVAPEL